MSTTLPCTGHVGGHQREAFQEAVQESWPDRPTDLELLRLAGLLWGCAEVMPRHLSDDLDVRSAPSYAQGARAVRKYARFITRLGKEPVRPSRQSLSPKRT